MCFVSGFNKKVMQYEQIICSIKTCVVYINTEIWWFLYKQIQQINMYIYTSMYNWIYIYMYILIIYVSQKLSAISINMYISHWSFPIGHFWLNPRHCKALLWWCIPTNSAMVGQKNVRGNAMKETGVNQPDIVHCWEIFYPHLGSAVLEFSSWND